MRIVVIICSFFSLFSLGISTSLSQINVAEDNVYFSFSTGHDFHNWRLVNTAGVEFFLKSKWSVDAGLTVGETSWLRDINYADIGFGSYLNTYKYFIRGPRWELHAGVGYTLQLFEYYNNEETYYGIHHGVQAIVGAGYAFRDNIVQLQATSNLIDEFAFSGYLKWSRKFRMPQKAKKRKATKGWDIEG